MHGASLSLFLAVLAAPIMGCGGRIDSGDSDGAPDGPADGGDLEPATGALSTELGRADWSDYATIDALPAGDILLSTWTHVVQAGPSGNDYPFVIGCGPNNAVSGCSDDYIICVAGNVGPDAPYYYNVNTMSCTGDHDTVYARCTEAEAHAWVFVAWHISQSAGGTTIRQYLKLGPAGTMTQVNPTAGPETQATRYAVRNLSVGGSARGDWAPTYQMYSRVHEMGVPTAEQVDAIAMNVHADATAWADWSLIAGDLTDRSGHGRHLTVHGAVHPGIPGPF